MRVDAARSLGLICVLAWVMAAGCSDDDGAADDTDAGVDSGGGMDSGCEEPTSLGIDPADIPGCPTSVCESGGSCLPNRFLTDMDTGGFLAPCDENNTCVPDEFIVAGGEVVPERCESLAGLEGRCMSKCLPSISEQTGLPQSTCDEEHLCAPCFDPLSGESTGACTLSCDMPESDPVTFDGCCGGIGKCIPTVLIPTEFQSQLGEDTCPTGEDVLCVPDVFIEDFDHVPPSCDASVSTDGGVTGLGPGACLALCVAVATDPDAAELDQTSCASGEVCVPCTDPDDGMPTGACELGGGPSTDGGMGDGGTPDGGA